MTLFLRCVEGYIYDYHEDVDCGGNDGDVMMILFITIIMITTPNIIFIIMTREEDSAIHFIDENGENGVNSGSDSSDDASPSSEQQIVITINQVIFTINEEMMKKLSIKCDKNDNSKDNSNHPEK